MNTIFRIRKVLSFNFSSTWITPITYCFFFISATEEKTFELGSNVTLTCGNISNLSSSTELSWRKGDEVLLNTTSHNESSLVLTDLTEEANGLYVCKANSSQILRSVQLSLATNGEQLLFMWCTLRPWKERKKKQGREGRGGEYGKQLVLLAYNRSGSNHRTVLGNRMCTWAVANTVLTEVETGTIEFYANSRLKSRLFSGVETVICALQTASKVEISW